MELHRDGGELALDLPGVNAFLTHISKLCRATGLLFMLNSSEVLEKLLGEVGFEGVVREKKVQRLGPAKEGFDGERANAVQTWIAGAPALLQLPGKAEHANTHTGADMYHGRSDAGRFG